MIAIVPVLLLLGLGMMIFGWHGRAIDDHPLCRRCGFDLTGKPPSSDRCPECGADLTRATAVRMGRRRRRPALLGGGVLLLLSALSVGSLAFAQRFSELSLLRLEPTWWLARQATHRERDVDAVLAELEHRLLAGKLPAVTVDAVSDRALAAEVYTPGVPPWSASWVKWTEDAGVAGLLSPDRRARLARQAVRIRLLARALVPPGTPPAVELDGTTVLLGTSAFHYLFRWDDFHIDGKPAPVTVDQYTPHEIDGDVQTVPGGAGLCAVGYYDPRLDRATQSLPPGSHTLAATLRLTAVDSSDLPPNFDFWHASVPTHTLGSFSQEVAATFSVVEPGRLPPETKMDPALRPAMRAGITVKSLTISPGSPPTLSVEFFNLPMRSCFGPVVRTADGRELGSHQPMTVSASSGVMTYSVFMDGSLRSGQVVDVMLRPDVVYVRDLVDMSPIWGEEVVVHGVVVK